MSVFALEIRNTRKSVIRWMISISAVIIFLLTFFPSMQTESMKEMTGAKLDGIDPSLLAAMGLDRLIDFTVITNFFGYALQYITLAIMVFITHQAVSLLIKEETDGTIEYLYGKPLSRGEIFTGKLFAQISMFIVMLLVFAIITVAGYLCFSDFTPGAAIKESAIFYGAIFFIGLVFMSVGVLMSTLIKSNKSASSVSISIVFATFIIGIMSILVKGMSFLGYLSPMDWIKTQKLMTDGILPREWFIGIVLIAGSNLAAYVKYRKKDLLV